MTARPTPQAILFDLDGVLVKSEEAWFRTVEAAGVRFRGRPVTRAEFTPTFGQGTAADRGAFGLKCTVAELDRFFQTEFVRQLSGVWVNPAARAVLAEVAARGLGCALVTNSTSAVVEATLKHAGLDDLLPVRATADRVTRAKPAPDMVLLACRELKVSVAQAWMVGDSRYDREAAAAAGVFFVGLGLEGDLRIESLNELSGLIASGNR